MRNQDFAPWVLAIALMSIAVPAAAITPMDAANLFGTTYGDGFSSIFLNQIFGPIFPSVTGPGTDTVFSIIVGYFNVIMLVIGGILFFYNATIGLLQSANEGQVLGQRWSSLWAPLRILFAVGLLVPVPNLGGYNLVQSGVAYIVKGSTNVATAVWSTSATLVMTQDVTITSPPPQINPDIVRTLFENAACAAVINHKMRAAAGSSGTPNTVGERSGTGQDGVIRTVSYLNMNGLATRVHICGGRATPALPSYITNISEGSVISGVPVNVRDQIAESFTQMHSRTLETLQADMRLIVATHLDNMLNANAALPEFTEAIRLSVNGANASLAEGNRQIMDAAIGADRRGQAARQALLNRIQGNCVETSGDEAGARCYGEGWIGAGSWYMMFARLNNELSSLVSAQPTVTPSEFVGSTDSITRSANIASAGESSGGFLSRFFGNRDSIDDAGVQLAMDRFMESFDSSAAGLAALGFQVSSPNLRALSAMDSDSMLDRIPGVRNAMQNARDNVINYFSPGNRSFQSDPMIGVSELGKFLINLAGVLMGGALLLGFLSGGGVAIALLPIFTALITAGSVLHLLLPIMPFIFWILAVTGYFILVIEAMIAVNLWAIAHMRMDGEGISGEAGRNGWLMLLALLLTPVLMVFGFLVGMTIFRVTSAILDIGIYQAMSGILGGNLWVNLIAIASYTIFMAIFYMVLLERSFSLVSEFPGRVLKWMGAGAQLTNGEENKVRLAAGGAGLAVARGSGMVATPALRGAGAVGVSRAGAYGNPNNDPSKYGGLRRSAERWNTTSSPDDNLGSRIFKPIGRATQRLIGAGPNNMRPRDDGRGPPKSSG